VLNESEEPFDGDASFYMGQPEALWKAMSGEWFARARTSADWRHLSFAVVVGGDVGQQPITGTDYRQLRMVNSFSFLA
jgi:hypothetical protein